MPNVIYVLPDGSEKSVDVPVGQSIMDGSTRNNLPGIVAECGGGCSCATCHVLLGEEWRDKFAERTDEELELIEYLDAFDEDASRLSCQLVMSDDADGATVRVPEQEE